MKRYLVLLISITTLTLPTLATCSLEDLNSNVCSLPNLRKKVSPIYTHNSNVKEFSSNPETRLRPIDRGQLNETLKEFSPTESDSSYNTSCQFGVCLQNRRTPIFQQPAQ